MITCEAVLAEATYLTRNTVGARIALLEMLGDGFLVIVLTLSDQHAALLALIRCYANVPMSLADACIVGLTELYPQSQVLTLDGDFVTYRKNERQVTDLICPK